MGGRFGKYGHAKPKARRKIGFELKENVLGMGKGVKKKKG
jgi:hypothetical protein